MERHKRTDAHALRQYISSDTDTAFYEYILKLQILTQTNLYSQVLLKLIVVAGSLRPHALAVMERAGVVHGG